jgi:hypothetical protein
VRKERKERKEWYSCAKANPSAKFYGTAKPVPFRPSLLSAIWTDLIFSPSLRDRFPSLSGRPLRSLTHVYWFAWSRMERTNWIDLVQYALASEA